MKKHQRLLSLLLVSVLLLGALLLSACQSTPLVIEDSDTCIVIRTTEKSLEGKDDVLLIDYMAMLKEDGKLLYEVKGGMITSINGIENPADYSSCWMLYTSDASLASAAFGTVLYEGKEYGSAVVGAEELKLKPEELYIWVYKSFN
ncbi:MAG: hypothetical protein J6K61_02710 [Clostridia bacterium]|nr:hypothetical protein [Clostridia bacterium]